MSESTEGPGITWFVHVQWGAVCIGQFHQVQLVPDTVNEVQSISTYLKQL